MQQTLLKGVQTRSPRAGSSPGLLSHRADELSPGIPGESVFCRTGFWPLGIGEGGGSCPPVQLTGSSSFSFTECSSEVAGFFPLELWSLGQLLQPKVAELSRFLLFHQVRRHKSHFLLQETESAAISFICVTLYRSVSAASAHVHTVSSL